MKKIYSFQNKIDLGKEQELFKEFMGKILSLNYDHNWYYVYRIYVEIYFNILSNQSINNINYENLDLNMFRPKLIRVPKTINIVLRDGMDNYLNMDDKSLKYDSIIKFLEDKKKQLENEIYIMTKMSKDSNFITDIDYNLYSLSNIENDNIRNTLKLFSDGYISMEKISQYAKDIHFDLNQVDIMRLQKTKYINRLVFIKRKYFFEECDVWFGVNNTDIFIVGKVLNTDNKYKLILLDDDVRGYISEQVGYEYTKPVAKVISLTFDDNNLDYNDLNINTLTEGLTINKNGDVKITINPKKSYMEEYSETHRILVENYKNKNYEAMKQNIAFMFLLISVIERDKKYKNREKDIVKARAFAINDFKTYLSYIQKEEPDFNFETYYRNSELDKYVVNIPNESIKGIKTLLKTIML